MRERLEKLGGSLRIAYRPHAFDITAEMPPAREAEKGAYQLKNDSGPATVTKRCFWP